MNPLRAWVIDTNELYHQPVALGLIFLFGVWLVLRFFRWQHGEAGEKLAGAVMAGMFILLVAGLILWIVGTTIWSIIFWSAA